MTDDHDSTEIESNSGVTRRTALRSGLVAAGLVSWSGEGAATEHSTERRSQSAITSSSTAGVPTHRQGKLTASNGDGGDSFGGSVALDGDFLVAGAPADEDPNGTDGGSAYVYSRTLGIWTERAKLAPSTVPSGAKFGADVDIDGDRVVVGAPTPGTGTADGTAYLFRRAGESWSLDATLTQPQSSAGADDRFGEGVAIEGDTILVGAPEYDTGSLLTTGIVYVFDRKGNPKTQATITQSDVNAEDTFGETIDIDGTTAVVGAPGDMQGPNGGDIAGAAFVFEESGGTWSEVAKLRGSDRDQFDTIGTSVSIDGNTALVGAEGDEDPGMFAGSAYVFTRSNNWSEQARLLAKSGSKGDQFGYSVAVNGNTALVGANADDTSAGTDSGSAYVFTRSGSSWSQHRQFVGFDTKAADGFGSSVALGDDTGVVSAPDDDNSNGTDAGSVYVYGPNQLPIPDFDFDFELDIEPVFVGTPVQFDASDSRDPDGEIVAYAWDWDGEGEFDEVSEDPVVTHEFVEAGTREVSLRVIDDDGATATTSKTITVARELGIAVKPGPGRGAAPINPRSRGQIPVAVLGEESFDPAERVAAETLRFGDPNDVRFEDGEPTGGAGPRGGRIVEEDVDDDGDADALFRFPTREADFDGDDELAELVGLTRDGVPIAGTASIRIVGR